MCVKSDRDRLFLHLCMLSNLMGHLLILQGVMSCTECKNKLQVRISADDVCFASAITSSQLNIYINPLWDVYILVIRY